MPKHEKIAYAENAARINLALTLSASIESEAIIDRFSSIVDDNADPVDAYKSRIVTRSDLNLDGVIVDHYWVKDSRPAYALAYLDRVSAREHYAGKLQSKIKALAECKQEGDRQLANGNVATARDLYLKADRLVDEIEEIIVIQNLLGGATPLTNEELNKLVGSTSTGDRAGGEQNATSSAVPTDPEWPELKLRGVTRTGADRYIAIVDGIGMVNEGDVVSLRKGGHIFRWRIDSVSSDSIKRTRIDIRAE